MFEVYLLGEHWDTSGPSKHVSIILEDLKSDFKESSCLGPKEQSENGSR